jgi:hypothetical protein
MAEYSVVKIKCIILEEDGIRKSSFVMANDNCNL